MIEIKKISLPEEERFIRACQEQEEYKKYVKRWDSNLYEDYYLFYSDYARIGFCKMNISALTGVITAKPNIYLCKRLGRTTKICFWVLLEELFERIKVERISIRIYSNNRMMRKIARYELFRYEGIFKNAILMNGEYIDIYYYSLNVIEYNNFIGKYGKQLPI